MKHITISERGTRLGIHGERIVIYDNDVNVYEIPLNRVKTLTVCKEGVSISSNLIIACSERGIKMFFLDFRGRATACLSSPSQNSIYRIRQKQFEFIGQKTSRRLAAAFIYGKLRNQRALLRYYSKAQNNSQEVRDVLENGANELSKLAERVTNGDWEGNKGDWRSDLLGLEGMGARIYWGTLIRANLMPESFRSRQGRNAPEITNQALNFGYSILSNHIWQCLLNAGLEIYAGILHTFRPGKPSLVLDLMEEYRAFIVDRAVIKARAAMTKKKELDPELKKKIVENVQGYLEKSMPYQGKNVKLENIMQRQAYRLAAYIIGEKEYKPFHFLW
jgi:CRISPR-associated protein Cas1